VKGKEKKEEEREGKTKGMVDGLSSEEKSCEGWSHLRVFISIIAKMIYKEKQGRSPKVLPSFFIKTT